MNIRSALLCLLGLTLWTASLAGAQPPPTTPDDYFARGAWGRAADGYQQVVETDPANAQAWYRLGACYHNLERFTRAAKAYASADSLGFAQPVARYNAACAWARAGRTEEALDWLQRAVDAGFNGAQTLQMDTDLAGLREKSRFTDIVLEARKNAEPCRHDERYRQFDFWLGEWEVYDPTGQKVGENRIASAMNGCMVSESWSSAAGAGGGSINFYDPSLDGWRQIWVDAQGGNITAQGGLQADGSMFFEGTNTTRNGNSEPFRMTFTPTPDGRVRQFIEQSKDDGATWYTWFDGMYVRKTEESGDASPD